MKEKILRNQINPKVNKAIAFLVDFLRIVTFIVVCQLRSFHLMIITFWSQVNRSVCIDAIE